MDLLEKCRAYAWAEETRASGLYPFDPAFHGSARGGQATLDGAAVCMLGSSDYRALRTHPQVVAAAQDAVWAYGTSAGGSRLSSGNLQLHRDLEADLAQFLGYEAALVFAAGYMANLGTVSCLAGEGDLVCLDEKAHASLVDGARLAQASGATVRWFSHNQPDDLARQLEAAGPLSALVATNSLFPWEGGGLARLPGLVEVCERYGATFLVDDAHGVGVFGRGRGLIADFGLDGRVPLMTLSFGTSMASQGGAVLSDARTVDYLRHHARPQIFATGLSPADTAAAHAALVEIRRLADRDADALIAAEYLRTALNALGYQVSGSTSPVIPVDFPDQAAMLAAHNMLVEHGVYTAAAPPSACDGHQLQLSCTDAHTPDVLDAVIGVFTYLRDRLVPAYRQAA